MIMKKESKKDIAVTRLAEHFGFDLSDIVAFGDDYNDIGMLKECGVGMAVANALDKG
jgi:hydroxymethylpyrimidine pyrophosphatase-like HAD family hydrolase